MGIGSQFTSGHGTFFRVWAPLRERVELRMLSPENGLYDMNRESGGYWSVQVPQADPGTEYVYRLDGEIDRPDPASRLQRRGVHGPSSVVELDGLTPNDGHYVPPRFEDLVIYEIHTGTFTEPGTLDAAAGRLDYLHELGINAVELMPLSHFPGTRNWGYDGVYPFAVHTAYGGPEALSRFVEAAHARNIAVVLDVVYNHLGPEGNYLRDFAPYFNSRYTTPWGEALNFDAEYSDEVRYFFLENLRQWLLNFKVDGLRLDAVHAMFDTGAVPILAQLSDAAETVGIQTGRPRYLIAESLMNDSRVIRGRSADGMGMTAEWLDDFHHALHAKVTGERDGYYVDFGSTEEVETALSQAYVYSRRYSRYWKRTFGNSADDRQPHQLVSYIQNHDQVGNRPDGRRIASLVDFETQKLLAAVVLLGPYTPMLFMGEEYGETTPFEYFVSHSDPGLIESVRAGRRKEFADFFADRTGPDPQAPQTYLDSKLRFPNTFGERQSQLLDMYRQLISLRREIISFAPDQATILQAIDPSWSRSPEDVGPEVPLRAYLNVERDEDVVALTRRTGRGLVVIMANFGPESVETAFDSDELSFRVLLDTSDTHWGGPGAANRVHVDSATSARINGHSVIVLLETD